MSKRSKRKERRNNRNRTVMISRKRKPKHDECCYEQEPVEETCCYEQEPVEEACCYEQEPVEDACCYEAEPVQEACNKSPRKWNALDPTDSHPFDDTVVQEEDAEVRSKQESIESIVIKDSCEVDVTTTDNQAALNVQAALQAAIALVVSVSIADSSRADAVTQDLLAKVKSTQTNKQQVYIENSRGVTVSTTDNDIAINIQILLQILIALIVRLDIL